MSLASLKAKLLFPRLAIPCIPLVIGAMAYPTHPTVANVFFIIALLALAILTIPVISIVDLSAKGPAPLEPPILASRDLSKLVQVTVLDEAIDQLSSGRWRLRLSLHIANNDAIPLEVYDIRFHVYCNDTGLKYLSVAGGTDSVVIAPSNSMMGSGEPFTLAATSARTFELCPTVTREPASAGFTLIFGVFAFCVLGDATNRITARIPSDNVFCCQSGHLAKMNLGNIELYKRKHEKSLSGSILTAVCEDALKKQLAAISASRETK